MKRQINAVAGDDDNNDNNNYKLKYKKQKFKILGDLKTWNTLKKNILKLTF